MPTERLEPQPAVEQLLGPRRPSGWVLERLGGGRGPAAVVHAVDCAEVPLNAPRLTLDQALTAAERPGVQLCPLCGACLGELDLVPQGFDK
ncbi:DUF6233 domain-containing protein [Streptomyces sp. NPDC054861]